MKTTFTLFILLTLSISNLLAAEPATKETPLPSGRELAAQMAALQPSSIYVRFRLVVEEPGKSEGVMQLQMKERRSGSRVDVLFQALFPKERKGEGVLLQTNGSSRSGALFTPPNELRDLGPGDMGLKLFGSDLAYADAVEPHFTWPEQKVVGGEEVDSVACYILESRPPGGASHYALIRTWIDPKRMVPLRLEKYDASARLMRRIDTLRVVRDGGRYIPATLAIRTPGSNTVTKLEGARTPVPTTYTDADFSKAALKTLSIPIAKD